MGKPVWIGAYASQRFNLTYTGADPRDGLPRAEPDPGNLAVRDRRGASGDVTRVEM